jgi:hypothetical protein
MLLKRSHSKKADGVGFEPTNDFRRCRFSRSAKPLRALPAGTPLNKAETRLGPSGTGRQAIEARTRIEPNRDTTSQIETTHQTSQRQVALGLSRNDSKWRGYAAIVTLPFPATTAGSGRWGLGPPRCRAASITAMARASGG